MEWPRAAKASGEGQRGPHTLQHTKRRIRPPLPRLFRTFVPPPKVPADAVVCRAHSRGSGRSTSAFHIDCIQQFDSFLRITAGDFP